MEIDNIHDRRNNFRINSSKHFSTQKNSQNEIISLSSTLSKVNSSYYNKINLTNAFKKKGHNFNNPKEEDVNQLYFDNLNEKVFNLYNLVDEIKMKHNNEKNSTNKVKNNPKYYINNEYKEQTINFIVNNYKNMQKHFNNQISINKNTLTEMMLNNSSFKKIILNKKYNKNSTKLINRKNQNLKKNRKVICSISPEGNNNTLSNYNINSFSDFKYERLDKSQNRNNNYKLINIKENKKNNINRSPVGRFDSYFFNSYSNTDKKRLNNQVLVKNNINNINHNLDKKLEIESPACLSYQSILRKASPKEMSIEHNIEYDINNKSNSKNLNNKTNNTNKMRRNIIDKIPYNKKYNYKFITEKNIKKNYNTENIISNNNQTLNYDTNLILNYNKFKSTTVSKLIRDYYCNTNTNINDNEVEEHNSKNSSINIFRNKTENNSQIVNSVQGKTIENKFNNKNKNKVKKNIKNIKKDIKMHTPTKVEKIVQNDIEITLEYNKDNKIQQLILYDKNGKKLNFIPNDKINNDSKTINTIFNSKKRVIFKNKKIKNIIIPNSSYSKRNSFLSDNLNKWNNNENRSSVQLNKIIPIKEKEKQIYQKFKISPQKFYYENLGNNLIHSLNVSSPQYNYIQPTNKNRLPVNSNHKKTSKAFSAFKDTLLKSKNYNKIKNNLDLK